MKKTTTKSKLLCALFAMALICFVTAGFLYNGVYKPAFANSSSAYVELYSPVSGLNVTQVNEYFTNAVKDDEIAPHGKVLQFDYKVGHDVSIDAAVDVNVTDGKGFQGLAMWVDIPETADEYSFTLYVIKDALDWQVMNLGSELTLVSTDGKVTTQTSMWKRQYLNGFKGWVLIPALAYPNPAPEEGKPYRFSIMMEKEPDAFRTTSMKWSIGSIGYYTNYDAFLYEIAGESEMDEFYANKFDGYLTQIQALEANGSEQLAKKNKMLVYFANIKENFKSLSLTEKIEIANTIAVDYSDMMQDFNYGNIKQTDFVMSFAITSDTHFTNTWINENFLFSLEDAKNLDPNLSAMFVLGDLSDNGISVADPSKSDLDNYYDWRDSYQYKNAKGEQIPIISVMGNHDVRGPYPEYPKDSYDPAVEFYKQREGVDNIQFDKWINGYHFIFLNTDQWHSDNCYLSEESLLWLDKTLGENEDGKPIFVMVHQPLGNVITMAGSSITFEEVIAKHPTAIVSSGHTHSHFGTAKVIDEGKGVYVNQPAMVVAKQQYYFVEVYEGGVIYRAREAATQSWLVDYDVVIKNEDRRINDLYTAENGGLESIDGQTNAEVVKHNGVETKSLKLDGVGSASLLLKACGEIKNYAGYAIYATSENSVKLEIDGNNLISGATYYALENLNFVSKTVSSTGEIDFNGWVIIPKEAINGEVYPESAQLLTVYLTEEQTVYLDKVSYYFSQDTALQAITNLEYSFVDYNGESLKSGNANFNDTFTIPTNPERAETDAYLYQFLGWDINGDGDVDELPATIKGTLKAVAVYKATIKQYSYKFLNDDGSVFTEGELEYGATLVAPNLDGLFGWDLDGDGAVESLPKVLTYDVIAKAVIADKQYKNGTVVFDAGSVSKVNFELYSYEDKPASALNLAYDRTQEHPNAPGERVATFQYNYTDGTVKHENGSVYVRMYIPYLGSTTDFAGYAIWVDIPATEEPYIGGLRFNGDSRINPKTNGWTLIDSEGKVTYQDSKWESVSTFPELGNGFTGWILVDASTFEQSIASVTPNANGYMTFQIAKERRTTSYVMNVGQVLYYTAESKQALIEELCVVNEKTTAMYTFSDGNGLIYKSGIVEKGTEVILPENPIHNDNNMFFAGWDIDFDGEPNTIELPLTITKNIIANAVFYHKQAFETIFTGNGTALVVSDGNNTKLEQVAYPDSPSGKATKVKVNETNETLIQYQHLTIKIPDYKEPTGLAVWMDSSNNPSFRMGMWINFLAKMVIADGGDYAYWVDESGVTVKDNSWQNATVPANFKGWLILPLTTFKVSSLMPGDVLRLAVAYTQNEQYNPSNASYEFYVGECVAFNCSVENFMSQINQTVYAFEDYDGSLIASGTLSENQQITIPESPSRDNWEFLGWDINGDEKVDQIPQEFGRNLLAKAIYKPLTYFTYKFVEEDGTVILQRQALENSLILPPFRYEKQGDAMYKFVNVYHGYTEGMLLTEDIEFTVTYEKQVRTFKYQFVYEGAVVKSGEVEYGMVITAPETPVKQPTEHYTYEFKGWSGFESGMAITQNGEYIAVFEEVPNVYTVTYKVDGEVYKTEQVAYGTVITLPVAPEKQGDNQYAYEFSGWRGHVNGMTMPGDVTFDAVFDKVVRTFTITFLDSDGVTVISQRKVPYGSRVNPPNAPYKAGYIFVTWENYYGMAEVTEDANYKAVYEVDPSYVPVNSGDQGGQGSGQNNGNTLAIILIIGGGVLVMALFVVAYFVFTKKKK